MNAAAQMRRPRVAPAPPDMLSRPRALFLFGALALLFVVLLGRSLHLQWFDNDFLQGQGAARSSRAMEIPAHRGRIVDRFGDALAISTPVKSLWTFPDQLGATPAEMGALARILDTTPQRLAARLKADEDFAFLARGLPPETAERAMALRIKGLNEQNEYRRYYPGGEVTAHIVGFTGDQDRGQEGMELSQQAWLGGAPGSRRVVINRRGDVVEDVAAIRAPRAGRDLALSIDSRLQYLAFRELKAAVEAQKADAGGLVILDAHSGEILALANWPTYNPNARNRVAREKMRNRALTDVFEPGSKVSVSARLRIASRAILLRLLGLYVGTFASARISPLRTSRITRPPALAFCAATAAFSSRNARYCSRESMARARSRPARGARIAATSSTTSPRRLMITRRLPGAPPSHACCDNSMPSWPLS